MIITFSVPAGINIVLAVVGYVWMQKPYVLRKCALPYMRLCATADLRCSKAGPDDICRRARVLDCQESIWMRVSLFFPVQSTEYLIFG